MDEKSPMVIFRIFRAARGVLDLFLVILASMLVASAANAASVKPSCGGDYDLCGYADASGNLTIPRKFEIAGAFKEGLAVVRSDSFWGYIDEAGQFVIAPTFDRAADFSGGRAQVVKNGLAGIIDRAGNVVVEPQFAQILPFTSDVALVSKARAPETATGRMLDILLTGKFAFYDIAEGRTTDQAFEISWLSRPDEPGFNGLIWARSNETRLFGLMNARGEWVVKPRFDHVQPARENRAIVKEGSLWGAVDMTGQIAIPLEHAYLSYFDNGFGLVRGVKPAGSSGRQSGHGLIKPDGTLVGGRLFDGVVRPTNSTAARVFENGIEYHVNREGMLVRQN